MNIKQKLKNMSNILARPGVAPYMTGACLLTHSMYAYAGFGQNVANALVKVQGEMIVIGLVVMVLSICWFALTMMSGNLQWKLPLCAVSGGALLTAAPTIATTLGLAAPSGLGAISGLNLS